MKKQNLVNISRYISLILRHKPEIIGIKLDKNGWANVDELLNGVGKKYYVDRDILDKIVKDDNKQRYTYNEDKTLIRANQGHSVDVDVELTERIPPHFLYHGTGKKFTESIDQEGLKSKSRLYVHLSADLDTAENVGKRHGEPVIYLVDCKQMVNDGYKFYLSHNKVWLTKKVPVKYLKKQ